MHWGLLAVLSALVLGVYDLFKKAAVKDNAVPPVLFLSVAASAAIWLPLLLLNTVGPADRLPDWLRVAPLSGRSHALILAKSTLVSGSWIFNYYALSRLPLSIAAPIRSTAPLWTIAIAVALFGEAPTARQWLGIAVVLAAFFSLSRVGAREGIHFHRDKWVLWMVVATVLGALSAIYDKFLLQKMGFTPATIQCWFSIYLVVVTGAFLALWAPRRGDAPAFQWRWSIPLIGLTLLVADFLYFMAIGQPDALISVISPLRRTAVIVTFIGGAWMYREKNLRAKAWRLAVLLAGVSLLTTTASKDADSDPGPQNDPTREPSSD